MSAISYQSRYTNCDD